MPHDWIFAEALEQRRHDVPVDVIEHVDQREHEERACAQLHEIPVCRRLRHEHSLALEYSTISRIFRGVPRPTRNPTPAPATCASGTPTIPDPRLLTKMVSPVASSKQTLNTKAARHAAGTSICRGCPERIASLQSSMNSKTRSAESTPDSPR